jgi:hypothetical protein
MLSSVLERRLAKVGCALVSLDNYSVQGNVSILTLTTAALVGLW